MKQFLLLTLVAAALFFAVSWEQKRVAAANIGGNALDWSTPVTLSSAPNGAVGPHLAAASNGRLMLAYINRADTGNNPYYRFSDNNGLNWTAPAPIYSSSSSSVQVHAIFDQNNVGHAVWIEDETEIRYARQPNWGSNNSILVSQSALPPLDKPRLAASGSNRLDLVWVQNASGNISIHHAYSLNNGASWSTPGPIATMNPALSPDVYLDNDKLHVVWTQDTVDLLGEIAYAVATISGGSVSWSQPAVISDPGLTDANNPRVVVHNGQLTVLFTHRIDDDEQYLYRIRCNNNCTAGAASWNQLGNPISGSLLGVNTSDPFNVVSTAVSHQGCLFAYFHGTSPFDQQNVENEVIRGVNSCAGWAASPRDVVTADTHRSVFPILASQGKWLYLAYESGPGNSVRQISFHRAEVEGQVYLPAIFKR